jgi:hypothetical protein
VVREILLERIVIHLLGRILIFRIVIYIGITIPLRREIYISIKIVTPEGIDYIFHKKEKKNTHYFLFFLSFKKKKAKTYVMCGWSA